MSKAKAIAVGSRGAGDLKRKQSASIKGLAFGTTTRPYSAPHAEALEASSGTSIFDPVLCEVLYRWFCPVGGRILDPFAGGSVRGIVAAVLGYDYTGIDLSSGQIDANRIQADEIPTSNPPRWHVGDSQNVADIAPGSYDMIFSCPPYGDLERYSDDPLDLSAMKHGEFIATYRRIVAGCVAMLKPNRFAVFVVGDIRDQKTGFFRNLPGDTIDAFESCGAILYNESVLVTQVGSASMRVGGQFPNYRKLCRTHQSVLVFYNGDTRKIPREFGLPMTTDTATKRINKALADRAELLPLA